MLKKFKPIWNHLFSYSKESSHCTESAIVCLQNVVLKKRIGKFSRGTKFQYANIHFARSYLELYTDEISVKDIEIHRFPLEFLTIKK